MNDSFGYTLIIFILIILLFIVIYSVYQGDINTKFVRKNATSGKCDADSCSSVDPVSDPKYNMQQIIKQSILLEEHLANKNKRCRDCIAKHFLHIIGLAEEAQMLATNRIDKFPLIEECIELYNKLFSKWIKNYDIDSSNNNNFLNCCDELRTMRKKLIAIYLFEHN